MTKKSLSTENAMSYGLTPGSCKGHWSGIAQECRICGFERECKIDTLQKREENKTLVEENPQPVITPFDSFIKHIEYKCEMVGHKEDEKAKYYRFQSKSVAKGYINITVLKSNNKMRIIWGTSKEDEEKKVCDPLNALVAAERLAKSLTLKFEHE
ncbi:MAG: hypothetical protein ACYS6K_25095 [Planctomycetota bacterium]|jgi:hypothetical protein